MTDQRYSTEEAETLIKLMGPEQAKAFFARQPQLAPGTEKEYPTAVPDPLVAAEEAAEDDETSGLSVDRLNADTLNYQKRMQDLRLKQFETARDVLKERQAGPSMGERLAQLSAAFFRPKWTPGWAGTMANVMPVLAKQSEATRTGRDAKADTLRELQDKYDTGTLTGEGDILSYRLKLAQLEDARRKAAKPKLQLNTSNGTIVSVPNYDDVLKPHSDEELAPYPDGTPYIAWEGSRIGQVLYKGAK